MKEHAVCCLTHWVQKGVPDPKSSPTLNTLGHDGALALETARGVLSSNEDVCHRIQVIDVEEAIQSSAVTTCQIDSA